MTVGTGACLCEQAGALICTGIDGIFELGCLCIVYTGLVKGLNEVLKALDRKQALCAVLASDCEDAKYKKFVTVSSEAPSRRTLITTYLTLHFLLNRRLWQRLETSP